ncbi:MAG: twin-arginine translocation signal domain-containing protein, partial [Bacteroidota bacterium]
MKPQFNRRNFLKTSSTIAAGIGLGVPAYASNFIQDIDERDGVEIAIATICLIVHLWVNDL